MATKADLINIVSETEGISKRAAASILTTIGNVVASSLVKDKVTVLPGVGKFKVVGRNARRGRNPKTGETIIIPERNVVKLVPAKRLKQRV